MQAEQEARRAAFKNMLQAPHLSPEDREMWEMRLVETEIAIADMAKDPLGYTAWLWADGNRALRKQTDRFPQ
jgi:ABC-type molybdate transport system substrate-binding protein